MMSQLKKHLEALANHNSLQEAGAAGPYPLEWDSVPYPLKFKVPTLKSFDGKRSLNQHIYYVKFQIGNVKSSDSILARLFMGTLSEVQRQR